jgi:hypothetical protein
MSAFERHREWLARVAKRDVELVSDADVIESLAIGQPATRWYLAAKGK